MDLGSHKERVKKYGNWSNGGKKAKPLTFSQQQEQKPRHTFLWYLLLLGSFQQWWFSSYISQGLIFKEILLFKRDLNPQNQQLQGGFHISLVCNLFRQVSLEEQKWKKWEYIRLAPTIHLGSPTRTTSPQRSWETRKPVAAQSLRVDDSSVPGLEAQSPPGKPLVCSPHGEPKEAESWT